MGEFKIDWNDVPNKRYVLMGYNFSVDNGSETKEVATGNSPEVLLKALNKDEKRCDFYQLIDRKTKKYLSSLDFADTLDILKQLDARVELLEEVHSFSTNTLSKLRRDKINELVREFNVGQLRGDHSEEFTTLIQGNILRVEEFLLVSQAHVSDKLLENFKEIEGTIKSSFRTK